MSALYISTFIELFLLGHDELLVFDPFFSQSNSCWVVWDNKAVSALNLVVKVFNHLMEVLVSWIIRSF